MRVRVRVRGRPFFNHLFPSVVRLCVLHHTHKHLQTELKNTADHNWLSPVQPTPTKRTHSRTSHPPGHPSTPSSPAMALSSRLKLWEQKGGALSLHAVPMHVCVTVSFDARERGKHNLTGWHCKLWLWNLHVDVHWFILCFYFSTLGFFNIGELTWSSSSFRYSRYSPLVGCI